MGTPLEMLMKIQMLTLNLILESTGPAHGSFGRNSKLFEYP